MFEDGIQHLWGRLFSYKKASSVQADQPLWHKIIGLAWVMLWLGVTSTWYFTPIIQMTGQDVFMVPVSLAGRVGLATSIGVAALSGIFLILKFEIEI